MTNKTIDAIEVRNFIVSKILGKSDLNDAFIRCDHRPVCVLLCWFISFEVMSSEHHVLNYTYAHITTG